MCYIRLTNLKHGKNWFAQELTEKVIVILRIKIFTTYKKKFGL